MTSASFASDRSRSPTAPNGPGGRNSGRSCLVLRHRVGVGSFDDVPKPRQLVLADPFRAAQAHRLGRRMGLQHAARDRNAVMVDVVPGHRNYPEGRVGRGDQREVPRGGAQASHGEGRFSEVVQVVIWEIARPSGVVTHGICHGHSRRPQRRHARSAGRWAGRPHECGGKVRCEVRRRATPCQELRLKCGESDVRLDHLPHSSAAATRGNRCPSWQSCAIGMDRAWAGT